VGGSKGLKNMPSGEGNEKNVPSGEGTDNLHGNGNIQHPVFDIIRASRLQQQKRIYQQAHGAKDRFLAHASKNIDDILNNITGHETVNDALDSDKKTRSEILDLARYLWLQVGLETNSVIARDNYDKGKRPLLAWEIAEEERRKEKPVSDDGKPANRIVNLSSECTPTNPIMMGGMKRLFGESSQQGNKALLEQREQAARHYERGEYDQAKLLYESALGNNRWKSPQDPLGMARAMTNLADIYTMERNFQQAVPWYERALPICEQKLGLKHGKTREIRANTFLGQQVGNYYLAKLLGYGGFGSVYLGEHAHLPNLQRAIKILNQVHLASRDDKDAF
jgi:tetratricopeptide (TPR) repeat protein